MHAIRVFLGMPFQAVYKPRVQLKNNTYNPVNPDNVKVIIIKTNMMIFTNKT